MHDAKLHKRAAEGEIAVMKVKLAEQQKIIAFQEAGTRKRPEERMNQSNRGSIKWQKRHLLAF